MRRVTAFAVLAVGLAACSDLSVPVAPTASLRPSASNFSRGSSGTPIAGQYIVRFRDDEQNVDGRANRIANEHAGRLTHVYRSAIKGMSISLSGAAAAALRADPRVLAVEQDQTVSISTTQTGATWGIDRID